MKYPKTPDFQAWAAAWKEINSINSGVVASALKRVDLLMFRIRQHELRTENVQIVGKMVRYKKVKEKAQFELDGLLLKHGKDFDRYKFLMSQVTEDGQLRTSEIRAWQAANTLTTLRRWAWLKPDLFRRAGGNATARESRDSIVKLVD